MVQMQQAIARKFMLRNIFWPETPVHPDFWRLQPLLHCAILRAYRFE